MNHPLKVYNPGSGIRYLLQWWSHGRQNQVIVADSERALYPVFSHVCDENPDTRIEQILEVELVAPSDVMCRRAQEYRHAEEVKDFLNDVSFRIKELAEEGYPLPESFKRCELWVPDYLEEGEETSPPDSYRTEWHPDCRNCIAGFTLVGHTPESFYQKYQENWRIIHPIKERIDPKLGYSSAVKANDDETIWVARPDFGHHCRGVSLAQLESDRQPYEAVLFYFRWRREIDKVPFEQMITEAAKLRARRSEEKQKIRDLKRSAEKAEAISKTLAVFK